MTKQEMIQEILEHTKQIQKTMEYMKLLPYFKQNGMHVYCLNYAKKACVVSVNIQTNKLSKFYK